MHEPALSSTGFKTAACAEQIALKQILRNVIEPGCAFAGRGQLMLSSKVSQGVPGIRDEVWASKPACNMLMWLDPRHCVPVTACLL